MGFLVVMATSLCSICYIVSMGSPRLDNRFSKTRSDHLSERAEDYVEAIADLAGANESGGCRVGALAAMLEVSHVTVVQALVRLESRGLVRRKLRGPVFLTPAGRRMAERSHGRHAIVLEFLLWLGVGRKAAERDAEGLEHHVSEETLTRMRIAMHRSASVGPAVDKSGRERVEGGHATRASDALRAAVKQSSRAPGRR